MSASGFARRWCTGSWLPGLLQHEPCILHACMCNAAQGSFDRFDHGGRMRCACRLVWSAYWSTKKELSARKKVMDASCGLSQCEPCMHACALHVCCQLWCTCAHAHALKSNQATTHNTVHTTPQHAQHAHLRVLSASGHPRRWRPWEACNPPLGARQRPRAHCRRGRAAPT